MSRHARSPEEIQTLFIAAIGNHDLDGLMALYDEDAVMVPSPGAAPSDDAPSHRSGNIEGRWIPAMPREEKSKFIGS